MAAAAEEEQKQMEEIDDEALTPTRRSLYRSASWSVRSSPLPSSNLNPSNNNNNNNNNSSSSSFSKPNVPKPNRRPLPPLQPLRRPSPALTSWPHLHPDDLLLQTPRLPNNFNSCYRDCSRIADHVYLGSDAVARDRDSLRRHGITHVLNCVGSPRCPDYFRGDLIYKTLWLHDSPAEDITSVLYDAFDYLEEVRSLPGARAFVHCSKGASRSASLVIAYLMWSSSKSFDDALAHVRSARAVTDPNLGFASQLLQCQSRVHALPPSPGSVIRVYRMAPHSPYDPLHLVPKAVDRPWLPRFDSRGAFIVVHVRLGIFVWLGKFCEQVMAASANAAARQVVRYEKVRVCIVTVKEGSESGEFWNVLVGEEPVDDGEVGNRRVELYDLDFEIFKRAIKGGVVPPAPMPGTGAETCLPARESGWSRVRNKFLQGGGCTTSVANQNQEENEGDEEEQRESQFRSPSSLSGDSSITSGDTASTRSTFSPASSSSLDWHSLSPSGSDLYIPHLPLPLPLPLQPPVIVSKLPPLHSRKVKKNEEETASLQSLAARRGGNPPSLVLLPPVEGGECRLSPRDIVRDWCLSPHFISDLEEQRVAMDVEQATPSSRQDDGEEEENSKTSDDNDHIWPNHPILFRWPSMERVEDANPKALDSKSVFMLLAPPDSSLDKNKPNSNILYVWLGRHCQLSRDSEDGGMSEEFADDRKIDLERIRVDLIDRMEFPSDIPVEINQVQHHDVKRGVHLVDIKGKKELGRKQRLGKKELGMNTMTLTGIEYNFDHMLEGNSRG